MSVVNKNFKSSEGIARDFSLMKVCEENGIGIFSVREQGGIKRDRMQVIVRVDDERGCIVSCNCRYYWSFNMYCSHIFAVFNVLQIRQLDKFEPFTRWTRKFHASVYQDEYPDICVENRTLDHLD